MANKESTKVMAGIEVSQVTTKVAHICKADNSLPSFEGEVAEASILWPVAFGRYRMSYCPWCGLKLPLSWKDDKKEG